MQPESHESIEQWDIFELELTGPPEREVGNPFTDVTFGARFQYKHRVISVDGFYDGGNRYRVRFMPDAQGEWTYTTYSSVDMLNGHSGQFMCVAPSADNHGYVRVSRQYHFAYDDGTPFYPVGTTCYAWTHQGDALERQTLETLKTAPFNKIRMCVFPKNYQFSKNEPELYPFQRTRQPTPLGESPKNWDFTRFNPAFFQHLEQRIAELRALNIEADIILLHPYDWGRWGFSEMPQEADERYLRYVVTRLAAYRNVWWSMANEYDIMNKPKAIWDRYFQIVQQADPYQHLRSVHNWIRMEAHPWPEFYDFGKPWVTHCSIQHAHVDQALIWREQYRKPVVLDEVCYEGDIPNGWGNLSAQELTRRYWDATVRSAYVTHGECYLDANDVLWWAKGGVLKGESPARIAFLRSIIEAGPEGWLEPQGSITATRVPSIGKPGEMYLTYYGVRQPGRTYFLLPEGDEYLVDLIDTWNMTIETLPETVTHQSMLDLPRIPYLALRLRRAL